MTDVPEAVLFVVSLLLVRIGAALRLTPFLGGAPLPWAAWAGLSVALSAVLAPMALGGAAALAASHPWPVLAVKELFVGIVLGASARIAFSIFEAAGRLTEAAVPLPGLASETDGASGGSPLAVFYALFGASAFFLVGGHHAFVAALAGSVRRLPVAALPDMTDVGLASASGVLGLFAGVTAWAFLLAAPVFVAGLAADLALGLAARAAPWMGTAAHVAPGVRPVVVQAAAVAALGAAVSAATTFLIDATARL
ncbi:MAG: flagellar biosynthetic protein FliR [Deltaproteobacteria bacterium]|nr:flagellar biosynthetic protein FliR [Deltaproteobacteria bacterium]